MTRSELLVTVLGLLGTFLLPWPGEHKGIETAVRRVEAPMHEASGAGAGQNCTVSPGARRAADRRESVAVVSADRG